MAGKYIVRSKEEKLSIVKRNLAGETSRALERETGCGHRLIQEWTKKYLAEGEAGLEQKKKPRTSRGHLMRTFQPIALHKK